MVVTHRQRSDNVMDDIEELIYDIPKLEPYYDRFKILYEQGRIKFKNLSNNFKLERAFIDMSKNKVTHVLGLPGRASELERLSSIYRIVVLDDRLC